MYEVIINEHKQAEFVLHQEAMAKLAYEFGERVKHIARNSQGRGVYSFVRVGDTISLARLEVAGEDVSTIWEGSVKET